MKSMHHILNHIRFAASSKLVVGALFVVLSGITLGGMQLAGTPAKAETCKTNNIMPCGADSVSQFVSKYKANEKGDYSTIYSAFGLSSDEIDRFARTAKMGVAYRDGTIKVDGKVVATNAASLGRDNKSYDTPMTVGGKTYYLQPNSKAFLSDLPVMVMMNGEQMEFAVLSICGNPIKGELKGNAPKYSCDLLKPKQINRDTFSYTTDVTALHGANVAKLVYDFGDGKSQTVTSASQAVTHTYDKAGSFTTKVTVYVTVNGETKAVTGAQCTKPVEVKPVVETPKPAYVCDALVATTINKDKREYRFTARTTQSGGATLKSASFDFGDKITLKDVKATDANSVSAEHTYASAGSYAITATVTFSIGTDTKTVTCKTSVTPEKQPPAECKPGIPVGDAQCTETPETPTTPETPSELPNTGAGLAIGSFFGASSILGAGGYLLRSRRNLVRNMLDRQ